MILDRVTFTGADDSIDPGDLIAISREYPYVEWGILFSIKQQGAPRFPSTAWMEHFATTVAGRGMNLSAHLCGRMVRDFVIFGNYTWTQHYEWLLRRVFFQRVQLNFHGEYHRASTAFRDYLTGASLAARPTAQFILQCDGVNDAAAHELAVTSLAVPLFDVSGGAGISPKEWPSAWPGVYCGYAGGLGPDNMLGEYERIKSAAGDARIWIDMERKVRSEDDSLFDLSRVLQVLRTIDPYVRR